ncbi:uncharacterized protein LOC120161648 isoform X2 [Hibiscus syriacus]|uniref:uncharacterized protein LOC120161648 isoform X2 n=1 Tax=Hibiscus syriacus TaxID=106335 RepID=UPI001922EDB2|nr:uncharacterized protein LOC120161648 isoform X2 [Hibiscus syriacus]
MDHLELQYMLMQKLMDRRWEIAKMVQHERRMKMTVEFPGINAPFPAEADGKFRLLVLQVQNCLGVGHSHNIDQTILLNLAAEDSNKGIMAILKMKALPELTLDLARPTPQEGSNEGIMVILKMKVLPESTLDFACPIPQGMIIMILLTVFQLQEVLFQGHEAHPGGGAITRGVDGALEV